MVEEPEIEETIRILHGLRKTYEQHHHVRYLDETISQAAYLADRYVNDRYMPDKAIDLLDEAGSMARLENISKPVDILTLEEEVEELNRQKNERVLHQEYEQAAAIRDLIQEKRDYLKEKLESWYNKTDEYTIVVGPQKVAAVVAESTGVPVENIEEEEGERLLRMEENLGKRIIGQEDAIRAITRAIKRSRVGLKRRNTPRGSFIFLGPTGVGKTEMAKALTEFLFDSQKNLIRLDMSEYMERHSVSKLVGSPPGYIGYDEGGQLTERIRRHPYSVILFDEIEKAHPDVFNVLLQVLEEGEMTDSGGTTVSFRDTVIILTSNVGNSSFQKGGPPGFTSPDDGDRRYELVDEEVHRLFAPEFLNRIDEVVYFRSLSRSDISRILDLLLDEVNERLKERNIQLECTSGVKKFLIDTGFDEKYGARNLRRIVQRELEDSLVDDLLSGRIGEGCCVQALKKGSSIRFRDLKERTDSPELVSSKSES
jgi:ATP-dependent Clp protease ATP-binding subunit ClpC